MMSEEWKGRDGMGERQGKSFPVRIATLPHGPFAMDIQKVQSIVQK